MTPIDILGAVCVLALAVGETYHRRRKRRWKKRVQRFHEQQAQAGATAAAAPADEAN